LTDVSTVHDAFWKLVVTSSERLAAARSSASSTSSMCSIKFSDQAFFWLIFCKAREFPRNPKNQKN
jgi:hypothetical protein